jgi:hypothetical protein
MSEHEKPDSEDSEDGSGKVEANQYKDAGAGSEENDSSVINVTVVAKSAREREPEDSEDGEEGSISVEADSEEGDSGDGVEGNGCVIDVASEHVQTFQSVSCMGSL